MVAGAVAVTVGGCVAEAVRGWELVRVFPSVGVYGSVWVWLGSWEVVASEETVGVRVVGRVPDIVRLEGSV